MPTPAGYQTPTTNIDFLTFNEVHPGRQQRRRNQFAAADGSQPVLRRGSQRRARGCAQRAGNGGDHERCHRARPARRLHRQRRGGHCTRRAQVDYARRRQTVPVHSGGLPASRSLRSAVHGAAVAGEPARQLALVQSSPSCTRAQDPFTSVTSNVDALTLADRKVGQKNLHIVEFIGTPPPPGAGIGSWAMLLISGVHFKEKRTIRLVIDSARFPGDIHFALPPALYPKSLEQVKNLRAGANTLIKRWVDGYGPVAKRLFYEAKYPEAQYKLLADSMRLVSGQKTLVLKGGGIAEIRDLPIGPKDEIPIFMRIDPPANTKIGSVYEFDIVQFDAKSNARLGGSRYRVVINRKGR